MIRRFSRALRILTLVFFAGVSMGNYGCTGTDNREKVDGVVEEFSGKKDLDRYQSMKSEINEIEKRQSKKYDQLN